jgi:hypothetical protein
MKAYEELDLKIRVCLTSEIVGDELWVSRLWNLTVN